MACWCAACQHQLSTHRRPLLAEQPTGSPEPGGCSPHSTRTEYYFGSWRTSTVRWLRLIVVLGTVRAVHGRPAAWTSAACRNISSSRIGGCAIASEQTQWSWSFPYEGGTGLGSPGSAMR